MDKVRYFIALFLIISFPGAILYWFSIHPFIGFWRKVGSRLTLAIHYTAMGLMAVVIFLFRKPLLSVEYGANIYFISAGIVLVAIAVFLRKKFARLLRFGILTGLPEISPEKHPPRLLTEGIYSRMRHPRYVQVLLALLGYALIANYLAGYAVFLLALIWIPLVVLLEEKELRQRFGAEYEAYCARVPRFIPKWKAEAGSQ